MIDIDIADANISTSGVYFAEAGTNAEWEAMMKTRQWMNARKIANRIMLLVSGALLSFSTLLMAQAGALDPTFGDGGIVTTPNSRTGCGLPFSCAMAIQSDGKIVVGGQAVDSRGAPELALARYNTDGGLDPSFGSRGLVIVPLINGGPAFGVAVQEDGKIVIAAPADFDIFVFRFNPDGTPDNAFGSGGRARIGTLVVDAIPGGIAVQPDGKILLASNVLARLLDNGQLDPTFGQGGLAPLLSGAEALSVLDSGQVLIANLFASRTGGTARYNSDGSLDLSFGTAGQTVSLGQPVAIASSSNGQFVVVGGLTNGVSFGFRPQAFVVARYDGDGAIDTAFGTRGAVVTSFPSNTFSGALAVAVQSDGAIVAAGFTAEQNCACGFQPSDFALARYTSDGQPDATFGTDGLVVTSFADGDAAVISALAIQSDGKIVAVGRDSPPRLRDPMPGFVLARYLSE